MRARRILVATSVGAATLVVGPLADPASAAITATTSGTVVTVTMTGNIAAAFSCSSGGKVLVNEVQAAPALACSAMTQASVTGDGGGQVVYGTDLGQSAFSAVPRLVASLGDGEDSLYETAAADQIDMGPGDDFVGLSARGPNNAFVSLGAGGGDRVSFAGTGGDDVVTATSTSSSVTISLTGTTSTTRTATGLERLDVDTGNGADTIDTTAVAVASTIDYLSLVGGPGDDILRDGPSVAVLYGGDGTNQLAAGTGTDAYWSSSPTDAITDANDGAIDYLYDFQNRRSGGRTLAGFDSSDALYTQAHESDTVARVRPSSGGTALLTLSLNRTGQQRIPASLGSIRPSHAYAGELPHRALVDVVAVDQRVDVNLPSTGPGLLDVTIPSGTWVVGDTGSIVVLSDFGTITASNVDDHRVHGPWTDRNLGFAHRATRDLLWRFGSSLELLALKGALDDGTLTRAGLVGQAMDTNEYRGLDVDRVFQRYLRRAPDPGGRTYWIGSLDGGKALWRFRAQLFGSPEYFNKAGGTNASYVRRAYQDVLGRLPDASGEAFWTNRLNNGADRGSVALQFMNSPEARRRLVDDQFLRFLDRLPTPTEQTTWVAQIPTDDGEQRLIAFLASSNAYFTRS
jgi:hypothetical protein